MRDSMHILDTLQDCGYTPQMDARLGEGWFDRSFGEATVRLVLTNDAAEVFMFGPHMVNEWAVRFSDNTPSAVILATLRAAEREAGGEDADTTLADAWTACGEPLPEGI